MNITRFFKILAIFKTPLDLYYLFFGLFCILLILSFDSDLYFSIIQLIISIAHLINAKIKILPSNDYINLLFNVLLVLTFSLKSKIQILDGIFLAFLQNLHLQKYKWKEWAMISQCILSVGLYVLNEKHKFKVDLFLGCFIIFFMFLIVNNHTDKSKQCKRLFKIKSSFFGIQKKKDNLEQKEKYHILDIISDSLIFVNTNTRTIYYLNQNALNIFSPCIPSTIADLPSWPLFPDCSSSTMTNSFFLLPSILDQCSVHPSKFKACYLSNYYEVSIHRISSSISVIRIINTSNQIQNNSSNLKMLSYVSHEFRTPLNCINTMLDALIRKAPENLQEPYIIPARDSLAYLLALVNDFLDMSQMMAGKFSLSFSEFKLKHIMKNVIKLMSLQAELKGIKLIYEQLGEIPEEIYSDPARLRQVLINLMSNAMKYTSKGWIKLKLDVVRPNLFHLQISDTGLGIKKEDQKKLLLDFGRIRNAEDKSLNNYGAGLGLVISDAIAKELSGQEQGLQVDSEWGKGSTFSFYLKDFNETDLKYGEIKSLPSIPNLQHLKNLEERANPTLVQSARTTKTNISINRQRISLDVNVMSIKNINVDEQPSAKKKCNCASILICDDNQFNILSLKLQLQNIGKNCDSASLGEIAIQKVKEKMKNSCCKFYKLIFMDLEMPVMNGFETSQQIKEIDDITSRAKIVACSGYDGFEERKKALKAGMEEFLVKPVMEKDLRRIVKEMMVRKKIQSEQDAKGCLDIKT